MSGRDSTAEISEVGRGGRYGSNGNWPSTIVQLWPSSCHTKINPDGLLSVVRLDEREFAFRLPLTLMNTGGKPDRLDRPCVAFISDTRIVHPAGHQLASGCLADALFEDNQGEVSFPIYLRKDEPVKLKCIIKWTPSEDYDKWNSESLFSTKMAAVVPSARIQISWKEKRNPTAFPFALLPAEDLRDLRREAPKSIYSLDAGEYRATTNGEGDHSDIRSSSASGLQAGLPGVGYGATAIAFGPSTNPGSTQDRTSAVQQRKSHYAVQGEIASGKEVASQNPGEVTVNIEPCGDSEDLVVFRAQFKKRILGMLPCKVRMVQVEKL